MGREQVPDVAAYIDKAAGCFGLLWSGIPANAWIHAAGAGILRGSAYRARDVGLTFVLGISTIGGREVGRAAGWYTILIADVGRGHICRNHGCEILADVERGTINDVAQNDILVRD